MSYTIKAPLPGTILRVNAEAGTVLAPGECAVVLEAMKMENEITADAQCTVVNVLVSDGQTVQAGEDLIEVE